MRTRPLAVLGLAAVLLTACGGSGDNGESAKKGPQVAADAADAFQKAGAAHLTGSGTQDGQPMQVDLRIVGNDLSGTVTMDGAKLDLVSVDSKFYFRASADFWQQAGVPEGVGALLGGKWVLVPSDEASGFDEFSLKGLADELRHPSDGTIKDAVHTTTLDGKKVVVVTQSDGSTLDVAATGNPYPLKMVNKGSDAGNITISDFGHKTKISAPSGAVDLTKLAGGGA